MNKKFLIAASILAVTAATSAQAADVVMRQPVVMAVPMFSWTGFYAGGQIGGAWSDSSLDVLGQGAFAGFANDFSPDPSGFIGGLYAGYNFDMGNNLVIGAETDWVFSNISKSETAGFLADTINATDYEVEGRIKEKWMGATRIRIGYGWDRWMPYIAGGVAYGKVDSNLRFGDADSVFSISNSSKTLVGWTAGAGVDYAVMDNVILRLEYRYTDLGHKDFANDLYTYRVNYKTNDFRVGVAYKF